MARERIRFAFDDNILDEFLFLAAHASNLEKLAKISGEMPVGSSLVAISRHATAGSGISIDEVERLLAVLQNMQASQRRMGLETGELLGSISEALAEYLHRKGQSERLEDWEAALKPIAATLGAIGPNHPVRVARKAQRLLQSHQHTMSDVRILTDLRPVFSEDGNEVLETIVVQSLIIDFFEGHFPRKIEIGLDAADLAALRSAVERAGHKALVLQTAMKNEKWPTKVSLDD